MKVLVIGSLGRTAREVVGLLLARGHEVTAFAGQVATLGATDSRLQVAPGDARDPRSIERAVMNQDAVISFLGSRSMEARDVVMRNLDAAMTKLGVKRLVNLLA
jgi:putative NADH-flavin reductase